MKCYWDGSEGDDDRGDAWVTLAGFAGTDSVWWDFDNRWNAMLQRRYPIAPYFHMIELLGGDDPFERKAGWTECKIQDLVQDAMVLLSQTNKAEFRAIRCSINISARDRLSGNGSWLAFDPVSLCARACAAFGTGWHKHMNLDPESIFLFFDRNERFIQRLKKEWLEHRTKPGKPKLPGNVWDVFTNMQEMDMAYIPGIQAADLLAWASTRSLGNPQRPYWFIKNWLQTIVPWTDFIIDEDVLSGKAPPRLVNNGRYLFLKG